MHILIPFKTLIELLQIQEQCRTIHQLPKRKPSISKHTSTKIFNLQAGKLTTGPLTPDFKTQRPIAYWINLAARANGLID